MVLFGSNDNVIFNKNDFIWSVYCILGYYTDRQGRPGFVNLDPFVDVAFNTRQFVYVSCYRDESTNLFFRKMMSTIR